GARRGQRRPRPPRRPPPSLCRPPRCEATTTSTMKTRTSSTTKTRTRTRTTTRTTRMRKTRGTRRIEESRDPGPLPPGEGVRIQKILAQAGMASRREAEEWIREGRVFVNGKAAKLGDRADPEKDSIRVGGKRIPARPSRRTYILLNKPKGYVTTVWDPERRGHGRRPLPRGRRPGLNR